jgi:hypothetical protein
MEGPWDWLLTLAKTHHFIQKAKHIEGEYVSGLANKNIVNHERLLADFDKFMKNDNQAKIKASTYSKRLQLKRCKYKSH